MLFEKKLKDRFEETEFLSSPFASQDMKENDNFFDSLTAEWKV